MRWAGEERRSEGGWGQGERDRKEKDREGGKREVRWAREGGRDYEIKREGKRECVRERQ